MEKGSFTTQKKTLFMRDSSSMGKKKEEEFSLTTPNKQSTKENSEKTKNVDTVHIFLGTESMLEILRRENLMEKES